MGGFPKAGNSFSITVNKSADETFRLVGEVQGHSHRKLLDPTNHDGGIQQGGWRSGNLPCNWFFNRPKVIVPPRFPFLQDPFI